MKNKMKSPVELSYGSVRKIKLIIVTKHDWTVKLLTELTPPSREINAIVIGKGFLKALKAGSKLGCMAVITALSKIIGKPFHCVDTTDDEIYFARTNCSSEEISKLRKVNKAMAKLLATEKKLDTIKCNSHATVV